jgi:hypothetical protein
MMIGPGYHKSLLDDPVIADQQGRQMATNNGLSSRRLGNGALRKPIAA